MAAALNIFRIREPPADDEIKYTPARPNFETIPWEQWMEFVVTETRRDEWIGKRVFQHVCLWAHAHLATDAYPITLQKVNGYITAFATETILPGRLRIPVFCIRDSSYLLQGSNGLSYIGSSHEVSGFVKWNQPVDNRSRREVKVNIGCQPERRQPVATDSRNITGYDDNADCHPFWHIRRSTCVGEFKSAVVGVEIKVLTATSMGNLITDDYHPRSGCLNFDVTVPCIVNTAKIASGTEIVLKWGKGGDIPGGHMIQKRVMNAFDNVPTKIARTCDLRGAWCGGAVCQG